MTQSKMALRILVGAVLSMLILIPTTAGAETSTNSNSRSGATLAPALPNSLGTSLASPAFVKRATRHTPKQLCVTIHCKRREWIKHHPKPKYPSHSAEASWYGPGFIGRPLGCPGLGVYQENEMGVANKTMPCGTRLRICYEPTEKCVHVTVVDRGPYVAGREFDLQQAPKEALGFGGTGEVKWDYAHSG